VPTTKCQLCAKLCGNFVPTWCQTLCQLCAQLCANFVPTLCQTLCQLCANSCVLPKFCDPTRFGPHGLGTNGLGQNHWPKRFGESVAHKQSPKVWATRLGHKRFGPKPSAQTVWRKCGPQVESEGVSTAGPKRFRSTTQAVWAN
jgi:hypothetical protein